MLQVGTLATLGLAGCGGSGGGPPAETDVVAGPDGRLRFDPETITVSAGESVTWYFASAGHNVSCVPDHHEAVALPDGAEPFASYEGDNRYRTDAQGTAYSHTFETPGEYRYVCIPHAPGMAGSVIVEA